MQMRMNLPWASQEASINSSGGSTSFRLNKYAQVGWYQRDAKVIEDVLLWRAMNDLNGGFSGSRIHQKVSVDPRRGTQALQEWKTFEQQWNDGFAPVDKSTFTPDTLKKIDTITEKMRTGVTLIPSELKDMTIFINKHFTFKDGYDISAANVKLLNFWLLTQGWFLISSTEILFALSFTNKFLIKCEASSEMFSETFNSSVSKMFS